MNTRRKHVASMVLLLIVVMAILTSACGGKSTDTTATQAKDDQTVASYYAKLRDRRPYPVDQMNDSLERKQLTEKLLRFNDPNKVGYVYLLSDTGAIVSYFTVKGKVSSNQSQLTSVYQIISYCDDGKEGCQVFGIPSPSDDGSNGTNEDGIFFFTTEGVYVSTSLKYLYLDAPLKVNVQPVVFYDVGSKPTSEAGCLNGTNDKCK